MRKVKPSGAAAGAAAEGEAGKALQPIAQAWTEVLDSRTGQTYWQVREISRDAQFHQIGETHQLFFFPNKRPSYHAVASFASLNLSFEKKEMFSVYKEEDEVSCRVVSCRVVSCHGAASIPCMLKYTRPSCVRALVEGGVPRLPVE